VADFKPGDRVAYGGTGLGAYAQVRLIDAARVVKLPAHVSDESAAALMLKGMTAYYLLFQTFQVRAGNVVLVHAAAGGVGSVLVPWAKHLGASVIGTAGGADKCALAESYGCDHVIDYRAQDFVAETRRLTGGAGVHVVYDSVGKDTLPGSLECLRRRGMAVSFGNASGKPAPIDPLTLSAKGSLFLTRPTLADYTVTREELLAASGALFEALRAGVVKADVRQRYALRDVAQAHADLEARKTSGTTLLMP
jgi:NADPH2:quinone reductase